MPDAFSVRPLRSGSSGNLTLVEHAGTILLLDAGLPSQRSLALALSEGGVSWDDVDAVLVSHLHGDHIHHAAAACCARHGVPIFLHSRNVRAFSRRVLSRTPARAPVREFDGEPFSVGSIGIRPFPVPHDAEGVTCGFRLAGRAGDREVHVSVATDLGHGGNGLFEEFLDILQKNGGVSDFKSTPEDQIFLNTFTTDLQVGHRTGWPAYWSSIESAERQTLQAKLIIPA